MSKELNQAIEYHRQGDLDEAARLYEALLESEPDHADALHLLGVIAHQKGDQAESERLVRQALERDPERGAFHCSLGNVHRARGEDDEALSCFEKAVELDPNLGEGYINLGSMQLARGELDQAETNFKMALVVDAGNAQALNNMGYVLLRQNRAQEAVSHLMRAVEAAPRSAVAQANLGSAFRAQGTAGLAVQCFENAIELRPDMARAHAELGEVLVELHQPGEARAAFEKAIDLEPDNAEARRGLARLLRDQGDSQGALVHLEAALRGQPGDNQLLEELTEGYLAAGRFHDAAQAARALAQRAPDTAAAQLLLGRTRLAVGDRAGARQAFERAGHLAPEDLDTQILLAEALEADGRLADSEQAADRALGLAPGDPWAAGIKARNLLRAGRVEKARDRLNEALAANPPPAAALALEDALALASEAAGDAQAALAATRRAHGLREQVPGSFAPRAPDPATLTAYAEAVAQRRYDDWPDSPPADGRPAPALLFGLPGSGLAAFADLLAGHPSLAVLTDRFGAGFERRDLFVAQHSFDRLGDDNEGRVRMQRRHYWQGVRRTLGELGERRVVDVLPPEHTLLEAAWRYLPEARLIWLVRDPRDALLECHLGPHSGPLATAHYRDADRTADYLLALARLFDTYRKALPAAITVLRYEDLAGDFAGALGEFHRTLDIEPDKAVAKRLGEVQSTALPPRPFSSAAVGRHAPYGQVLDAALERVQEAAEILGYGKA